MRQTTSPHEMGPRKPSFAVEHAVWENVSFEIGAARWHEGVDESGNNIAWEIELHRHALRKKRKSVACIAEHLAFRKVGGDDDEKVLFPSSHALVYGRSFTPE